MNFQANYPIYLQIAEDIKRRIVIGELKAGDKLPSNAELALAYQVNPQYGTANLSPAGGRGHLLYQTRHRHVPHGKSGNAGAAAAGDRRETKCTISRPDGNLSFSKEEIIHLLEAQAQQQEKEGTSC